MADTTDCFYPEKEIEVAPNHTGHACKVFAIHMGILLVICHVIGIWRTDIMWILGGSLSFFMVPWHGIAIRNSMEKDEEYWKERFSDDD